MNNIGNEVKYLDEQSIELLETIKEELERLENIKLSAQYMDLFNTVINNIENENYYNGIETYRILTSLSYAMKVIKENIDKGLEARNDINSLNQENAYFSLNELINGIIIGSKNEFEDKKLKYYGFLLGNMIFKNDLNQDECNRLIRVVTTLSYCKIKLINLYFISQTIQVPILKRDDYTKTMIDNYKLLGVLQDTLEMVQKSILNGSGKLILDVSQINPSKIRVQGMGVLLYNLMNLNKMPYNEMKDLLDILSN